MFLYCGNWNTCIDVLSGDWLRSGEHCKTSVACNKCGRHFCYYQTVELLTTELMWRPEVERCSKRSRQMQGEQDRRGVDAGSTLWHPYWICCWNLSGLKLGECCSYLYQSYSSIWFSMAFLRHSFLCPSYAVMDFPEALSKEVPVFMANFKDLKRTWRNLTSYLVRWKVNKLACLGWEVR